MRSVSSVGTTVEGDGAPTGEAGRPSLAELERTALIHANRARFHASYRLAGRAYQALLAWRAGSRYQLAAAGACAIVDLVSASALARSSRFGLWPRWVLDAVDGTAWSLVIPDTYEAAVIGGMPLAVEAGVRLGGRSLAVPLANAAVAGAVRSRRRRPLGMAAFSWQLIGALGGWALGRYEERRWGAESARITDQLEAKVRQAHLVGQNAVAMGADSLIDLLSRTAPLVESKDSGLTVAASLATWKASLAVLTSNHAAYLGTAVAEWQRRRNTSPDLSTDVELVLAEGDGTVVLSAAQVAQVESALDALDLGGGSHRLTVEGRASPGQDWRLGVGDHGVAVTADPATGLGPFDPSPVFLLLSAGRSLALLSPDAENVPLWAGLPGGLASVTLALWAHQAVRHHRKDAHPRVLAACLVVVAIQAALVSSTMRRPISPEGLQRFPFVNLVSQAAVLLALYGDDVSRPQRQAAAAGIALSCGAALALSPFRIDPLQLAVALAWPLAMTFTWASVANSMRAQARALAAAVARHEKALVEDAYHDGRSAVLGLVAGLRFDLWQCYHGQADPPEGSDRLTRAIRQEAFRRLGEVDRRLEEMRWPVGS